MRRQVCFVLLGAFAVSAPAVAQVATAATQADARAAAPAVSGTATAPSAPVVPPDYVIGPQDVLTVIFWREKDLTGDVTVRPDGRISLPLLNEINAAGLTTDQLRTELTTRASKYLEDPNVTIVVKAINSRKVFVTGQVRQPGVYPLIEPMTVMQLLAVAGGVQEFADTKNILVMRSEKGKQVSYRVNYKELLKQRHPQQNIELRPGDTVIVP